MISDSHVNILSHFKYLNINLVTSQLVVKCTCAKYIHGEPNNYVIYISTNM